MKKQFDNLLTVARQNAMACKVSGSVALMTIVPAMTSFAAEPATPKSALEGEVWTSITDAFGSLAVTASQVMAIAVVTGCGIIAMTTAAKYAMKKIKGMLNQAA